MRGFPNMPAAIVLCLTAAGCVTSGATAEFAAMPDTGPLTPTRLEMARANCQMKWADQVDTAFDNKRIPDVGGMITYAKACYASQGILVTGFRQKTGQLTANP